MYHGTARYGPWRTDGRVDVHERADPIGVHRRKARDHRATVRKACERDRLRDVKRVQKLKQLVNVHFLGERDPWSVRPPAPIVVVAQDSLLAP